MMEVEEVLNLALNVFNPHIIHLVDSIISFYCHFFIAILLHCCRDHREAAFSDMRNYFVVI